MPSSSSAVPSTSLALAAFCVPNSASGVQVSLGATNAAAIDLNTACTSFLYGLSTATAMIRTGVVRNAVVIGVELITRYMDWSNRNVAVLFGDGAAAVVLQASDREEGVIGSVLGCDAEARPVLRVRGVGCGYANRGITLGDTIWDFDGPTIFKRAVKAMSEASARVMQQAGVTADDIGLVVPHQANGRILQAVQTRSGVPAERFVSNVARYGSGPEFHSCPEEIYVLGGDVTGRFGTMTEGSYFWRPRHVLHSPMGSETGCELYITVDGDLRNHYLHVDGPPPGA